MAVMTTTSSSKVRYQCSVMEAKRIESPFSSSRSTVVRGGERSIGGALVTRDPVALAGEAHHHGPVLISWSAARHDLRRLGTGRNVVIHEFAHKLDLLDGTPPLDGEALGLPSAVCDCEMLASCAAAAAGNPSTAIRTPNQ